MLSITLIFHNIMLISLIFIVPFHWLFQYQEYYSTPISQLYKVSTIKSDQQYIPDNKAAPTCYKNVCQQFLS